jgi:hypothetical protein
MNVLIKRKQSLNITGQKVLSGKIKTTTISFTSEHKYFLRER